MCFRGGLLATLLATTPSIVFALPTVDYEVKASAGSWRPMDLGDLQRTIEHTALEVLTKPGLIQLQKLSKDKTTSAGDYRLEIHGRLLDEAETHTVYLSFGPGQKGDLPSFTASHSATLRKKSRPEILSAIQASAKTAAQELVSALKPHLAHAGSAASDHKNKRPDPFRDGEKWPFAWSEVHVPGGSMSGLAEDLFGKNHDKMMAAFRVAASKVRDEDGARNLIERCALEHPKESLRLDCLVALRNPARRLAPTQRVVIEVLRRDKDSRVRKEASEQMTHFTGIARQEAVQAWLQQVAAGQNMGELSKVGDLPNLDLAIRSCFYETGKKEKGRRSRSGCLELMGPLSYQRRAAILWRFIRETDANTPHYLDGAGDAEGRIGTDWQRSVEALLEEAPAFDDELGEILWRRYGRDLSSYALRALAEYATPSARLVDRLIEAFQSQGDYTPLNGLERIAKSSAQLRPKVIDKLTELKVTGNYAKGKNANSILEERLKRIEKLEAP